MSLERRWKNDGLLPDAIDLRLAGGLDKSGAGWGRSGCDAISQVDTSSSV